MKNKELYNELVEIIQYFFDMNPKVTGIDLNYYKSDNHGELVIRTEKKDKSYIIKL